MWLLLKEWFGGKMALYLSFFVTRFFVGQRTALGDLPYGRRGSGNPAEVFPVIAVVADDVCDLAEGLVRDGVLEGHDEGSGVEDG
jgi:hypothetical protein